MLALRPVNTNIIDGTPIGASYSFRFRLLDLLPNDDFTLSKTSKKGPKICQDCMEIINSEQDCGFLETITNICS